MIIKTHSCNKASLVHHPLVQFLAIPPRCPFAPPFNLSSPYTIPHLVVSLFFCFFISNLLLSTHLLLSTPLFFSFFLLPYRPSASCSLSNPSLHTPLFSPLSPHPFSFFVSTFVNCIIVSYNKNTH